MPDYDKMTVAMLRKTAAYKKIPRNLRKSRMRKADLIKALKKYEKRRSTLNSLTKLREECRKKGLVYDIKKKECRESLRRRKSPKKSPRKRNPKRSPKKSPKKDCMSRYKVELAPHQRKVAEFLQRHRGVIAVHGLGTGKTLTAITSSQCFLDANPTKKVIVISPASLIANFKKGMEEFGGITNPDKYEFYSFDSFLKMQNVPTTCKGNMLIVDEAHNLRTEIKELSGKKTAKVLACSKTSAKVLLLTATPVVNSLMDLVPLISMVTGKDYEKIRSIVSDAVNGHPEGLRRIAKCIISVYSKGEQDPNYPKRINKPIYLTMHGEFLKKYEKLERKEIPEDVSNPSIFYAGFRTRLLGLEDSEKIKFAVKKAADFAIKGKKTVIYSNFSEKGITNVVQKLNETEHKDVIGIVSGDVSLKRRKDIVKAYNEDKIKILLITKAGGEGLDLKNTAAIFILDPPWNEAAQEQAIGRAIRYKSHINLPPSQRKVYVYTIYSVKPNEGDPGVKPSVDLVLKKLIDKKHKMTNDTMEFLRSISIENPENKC